MYAGHVGIALGAKGVRSSVPLWALIVASQLPDWADATICLAGITSSPSGMYSHSLPAIGVLTIFGMLAYLASTRDLAGSALVAALVISHALADYVTGTKPTWSGGPMLGLQLYRHPGIDFVVEAIVILLGWLVYRASFPQEKRSSRDAWSVLGVLLALQLLADIVFSISPGLRKC
ncbi:MAG TPA: hypothetical protein VFC35_00240 [Gemmatimonadaceae bacterium]|nr:hypothetical protein [Gemmatimonadaceae bacterium]